MFHKVIMVKPLNDYKLLATFQCGTEKLYDLTPLFSEIPVFSVLKVMPKFFSQVKVDTGGYGISWSDDIDLSSDELWEHGTVVNQQNQNRKLSENEEQFFMKI